MELGRILLYSANKLWRYVPARLKYKSACYSSSKLQWSGGILRCLNGMDCCLLFPVVSVRLLMVSEHRWLTLCIGKARQTRFIISHQPLTRFACGRAVIIHYSLLANAICTQRIYGVTAIKVGVSLLGRR